jgi:hypothetical protein
LRIFDDDAYFVDADVFHKLLCNASSTRLSDFPSDLSITTVSPEAEDGALDFSDLSRSLLDYFHSEAVTTLESPRVVPEEERFPFHIHLAIYGRTTTPSGIPRTP